MNINMNKQILTSDKIYLTELSKANLEQLRKWRNMPDIFKYFYQYSLISTENHLDWYQKTLSDSKSIYFEIHHNDGTLIGLCCLIDINWLSRTSDFSIYIGDKNFHGQGLGKESLHLLFDYAFNVLNLERIYSHVFDFNQNAIGLYQKLGFKIEGTLRKHHFHNGKYINVIIIGLLKNDYQLN